MIKLKTWFDLQRFAEGDPVPPPADPVVTDPPADPPTPTDTKPYATFPDEKSFMARVSREAKKSVSALVKSFGLESEEELKTLIDNQKAADELSKTDLQKAQEKVAKLESESQKAWDAANSTIRTTEAKVMALTAGVKPEKVNYLLKMMDLTSIEVKDGVIDAAAVQEQIDGILKDLPELKGATVPTVVPKGGEDFKGGDNKPLTYASIKAMSTKETVARLPEIQEFMKNNPNK